MTASTRFVAAVIEAVDQAGLLPCVSPVEIRDLAERLIDHGIGFVALGGSGTVSSRPGVGRGEVRGPVPAGARDAEPGPRERQITHYQGDDCPGGHRTEPRPGPWATDDEPDMYGRMGDPEQVIGQERS